MRPKTKLKTHPSAMEAWRRRQAEIARDVFDPQPRTVTEAVARTLERIGAELVDLGQQLRQVESQAPRKERGDR